jgi:hypothetical protein
MLPVALSLSIKEAGPASTPGAGLFYIFGHEFMASATVSPWHPMDAAPIVLGRGDGLKVSRINAAGNPTLMIDD